MFWLLALCQKGVAPLAHHSAERVRRRCGGWRPLPRRDATTVHVGGEEVPVVTGAREGIGSNLRGVPRDRSGGVDVLASFLVKSLVKQEI